MAEREQGADKRVEIKRTEDGTEVRSITFRCEPGKTKPVFRALGK